MNESISFRLSPSDLAVKIHYSSIVSLKIHSSYNPIQAFATFNRKKTLYHLEKKRESKTVLLKKGYMLL